jgi:glycine/D-amino acid oxidase-like deaminating enzyme
MPRTIGPSSGADTGSSLIANNSGIRVAVLGGGITGTCVALELAEAGCHVDLFDRKNQLLRGASYNCEGKIHLGLVYANDTSRRTADTMIRGAMQFRPLLSRWVSSAILDTSTSTPFIYAVPSNSMLTAEEIRHHFEWTSARIESESRLPGRGYVSALFPPFWEELPSREFNCIFDSRRVQCAFTSQETALNPRALSVALRDVAESFPRLTLRCATNVVGVSRDRDGRLVVRATHQETEIEERFDTVVNALWEQRLSVDATLGIHDSRPVVHRFKTGLRTESERVRNGLPSVTFVLGVYGDTVAHSDHAYASWYPTGLLHQDFSVRPRKLDVEIAHSEQARIIDRSLQGLRNLMPGTASLLDPADGEWEVVGGYITAWGRSGIEDPGSELHCRYAVGVTSHGNYHSVDTGKLTLGPMFAAETCSRILSGA